ncbi:MCE family protein [Mycolicibacterium fluoranthenivorans]|jgi:virulence factor Mce-like protein|uniref:Virulence factor Mce family protein n=1 Tax=Mycolicibacterium fluoranthenivorans TaxID=258505 RepID=A0A1G4V4H6_9MYCO|nr:MCE family protein [Mycolicibacterium fluoranthenivorans]SCX01067.1 virulence factor Mce family protein [Mycolicibacterium fluoranthenivorans]
MNRLATIHRALVAGCAVALTASGCAFQGVNSLALPGVKGTESDAQIFHVEVANIGTLESNSPVMVDDVVVGSVGTMTADNWHADVEVRVNPGVVIPGNAVASVGQTSLLGSMHLALNPPVGEQPAGRLASGTTIPLKASSTYPSTEQTLSSLSVLVNGGGLGQIGDIIHNFSTSMSGREPEIRELITRLDRFVGVLDNQRNNIVSSVQQLNRVAHTFADQTPVLERALRDIPPAIDVLVKERPNFTAALQRLGNFSDTATGLVNDAGDQLVADLKHLEPAIRSLADIGPDITSALYYATAFPYGPNAVERAVKGDYLNLYAIFDLSYPRLKRSLFLGTRWGDENAKLVPAPGEPWYLNYSYDPLGMPLSPPPPDAAPPPAGAMPVVNEPILPVAPPPLMPLATPPSPGGPVFAGPYANSSAPAPAPEAAPTPGSGG